MDHRSVFRWLSLFVVVSSLGLGLSAQVQTIAVTGVNVVDVVDGRIIPDSTVLVVGETIRSVTRNGNPPSGAQRIDGRGKFLIPGLWDMHTHIEGNENAWLPLCIANGVTGIRDMGADLDFILNIREATRSGRVFGPRIIAAGPILDDAPGDWPFRMRVRNADEGQAAVRLLKRRGVDLIKVHNNTPRDAFFAIAEEAHQQQLPVAGHVPLKVTIQKGIDAGMLSIEHLGEDGRVWKACSGGRQYDAKACRPFFEMMAKRAVWQTPTLIALAEMPVIGTPASKISRDQLAFANKRFLDMQAANQAFFINKPEILAVLKSQAEVAKTVTPTWQQPESVFWPGATR